jgi:hypothetical protein
MGLHRHYRARLLEARSRLGPEDQHPNHVVEMALAHPISSGVEVAIGAATCLKSGAR